MIGCISPIGENMPWSRSLIGSLDLVAWVNGCKMKRRSETITCVTIPYVVSQETARPRYQKPQQRGTIHGIVTLLTRDGRRRRRRSSEEWPLCIRLYVHLRYGVTFIKSPLPHINRRGSPFLLSLLPPFLSPLSSSRITPLSHTSCI